MDRRASLAMGQVALMEWDMIEMGVCTAFAGEVIGSIRSPHCARDDKVGGSSVYSVAQW